MIKVRLYNLLLFVSVIAFCMWPENSSAQPMSDPEMQQHSVREQVTIGRQSPLPYRLRRLSEARKRMLGSPVAGPVLPPNVLSSGVQQSWVRNYPSAAFDSTFSATGIAIDKQGNVYVAGYGSATRSNYQFVTIKYTSGGNAVWVQRYRGPSILADEIALVAVDTSGNVYVTGVNDSAGTSNDFTTIKYDSGGNRKWVVRYNGPGNGNDVPSGLVTDGLGNVCVTGRSVGTDADDDYATVKYDPTGTQVWLSPARYNSGHGHDDPSAIAVDSAGNIYVTGSGAGIGFSEFVTIKYSPTGAPVWESHSAASSGSLANDVAIDAAGNVYVTGYSVTSGSNYDFATVKYNAAGAEQWVARFDGQGSFYDGDEGIAIAIDGSGSVYVTGRSFSPTGTEYDYATVKYNSSGVQQGSAARYAGVATDTDEPSDLKLDVSGNVYVTGTSGGDFATIKYSSSLVQQWLQRYDGGGIYDQTSTMALDTLGHVYVTGKSGSGNVSRFTTIKYAQILINASVKVFLEGPYSAGSMSNTLKTSGTLASHFTGLTIPANAVDSIAVEIRSSTSGSGSATRAFAPAWLLRDGTIKSFSDTTLSYVGLDAPAGSYYIVVWHRNHLAAMSASVQSLSGSVPGSAYDFTTGQSQAFGTNPMDQLTSGVFGMISGDANQSGIVSTSDANVVFGALSVVGYNNSDINLSGIVSTSDANMIFGNLSKTAQVP